MNNTPLSPNTASAEPEPDRKLAAESAAENAQARAVAASWAQHPFFDDESIVLGLDIGMQGIGIAVRRGRQLLYAKTLMVELPESAPLRQRRQYRAARHARKNRKTRMRRLRELFLRHGLPWVSDEIYGRSDPYKLRARAFTPGKTLASKEALSLCIRSVVAHRGFDYYALCSESGGYPWGESSDMKDAARWLRTQYVTEETRDQLIGMAGAFSCFDEKEITDNHLLEWERLVRERCDDPNKPDLATLLRQYASSRPDDRRARGWNFPRSLMEDHLRTIINKHRHLIDDCDGFLAALFRPCDTKADKKRAIFHYNRKTPAEARARFERKIALCPYLSDPETAISLGHADAEGRPLPPEKCGTRGEVAICRWSMLDFLSTRRFELKPPKARGKDLAEPPLLRQTLPEAAIRALDEALQEPVKPRWADLMSRLTEALKPFTLETNTKSPTNALLIEQLKDICCPSGPKAAARAGLSARAAELLIGVITGRSNPAGEAGDTPPAPSYDPRQLEERKLAWGLYEKRARIDASRTGIYPQVHTLLGTLRVHRKSAEDSAFSTRGLLQRLFEGELRESLGGKTRPDYCIIECIKNPACNTKQAREIQEQNDARRKRKEQLCRAYGCANPTHAEMLRLHLFEEQGGKRKGEAPAICPFTGESLGTDPLSPHLELAHIFPDARGGLYIRENLVLTTARTNRDMNNRTPIEAAEACLPGWSRWETIEQRIRHFRWNAKKLELFTFRPTPEQPIPDFNNITRTAQLARELRRYIAVWMGINRDVDAVRERIGNPCGSYTAAARRGMLPADYRKDRSNNLHHRIDAAVLTCIPPAAGLNNLRCGGIFRNTRINGKRCTTTIPGLPLPDFGALIADDSTCPLVSRRRTGSTRQSLGDSTFWGVNSQGDLTQRTPLVYGKDTSVESITQDLVRTGIRAEEMPDQDHIEQWILRMSQAQQAEREGRAAAGPAPTLRLKNGRPIRSIRKGSKKGEIAKSPLGWSGIIEPRSESPAGDGAPTAEATSGRGRDRNRAAITAPNRFIALRSLRASNDRLELWLGHDGKKWKYVTRVIPTKQALAGLKRMGLPWRGRERAPLYLIRLLDAARCRDLKQFICGTLPPHAVKVATVRKGDFFRATFNLKPKKREEQHSHTACLDTPTTLTGWGKVTALKTNGQIEISPATHQGYEKTSVQDPSRLAKMLGLQEDAAAEAESRGLLPRP